MDLLGPAFVRAWPVENAPPNFAELLLAIDRAERRLQEVQAGRR
jgi:hypothetical protein